jgi:hypothetical protein
MRGIGRLIGEWIGTACVRLLDFVFYVVLLVLVALFQMIGFCVRYVRRLFGASSSNPPRD